MLAPNVNAEEVVNGWNEKTRIHSLTRKLSTAINVYAKDGTTPQVQHESGTFAGVVYDVIRIDPSEDTFLQVDYSETPVYLTELVDEELIESGYTRVAGINGGYFKNISSEYGRPVGAVMNHGEWTTWNGIENVPSYGAGFATVYFNTYDMVIKYHGWNNGTWHGDHCWSWWQGYTIEAQNAIAGSYTYFVDGEQRDITDGDYGTENYRNNKRATTVFAQRSDKQYLLIEFYGYIDGSSVIKFLEEEGVENAIRLDGGGSCQMIYESDLVNLEYEKAEQEDDMPLFEKDAITYRRLMAGIE